MTWKRVGRCDTGACVEVLVDPTHEDVLVRSSKDPANVIVFDTEEWDAFVEGVKIGEFDR